MEEAKDVEMKVKNRSRTIRARRIARRLISSSSMSSLLIPSSSSDNVDRSSVVIAAKKMNHCHHDVMLWLFFSFYCEIVWESRWRIRIRSIDRFWKKSNNHWLISGRSGWSIWESRTKFSSLLSFSFVAASSYWCGVGSLFDVAFGIGQMFVEKIIVDSDVPIQINHQQL